MKPACPLRRSTALRPTGLGLRQPDGCDPAGHPAPCRDADPAWGAGLSEAGTRGLPVELETWILHQTTCFEAFPAGRQP